MSQRKRKRVEEIFGWEKVVGGIRKVKVRGLARVGAVFTFALATFNLVRMNNLIPVATCDGISVSWNGQKSRNRREKSQIRGGAGLGNAYQTSDLCNLLIYFRDLLGLQ